MKTFKKGLIVFTVVSLLLGLTGFSSAKSLDNFPSDPIQLIVPYGPGGSTDRMARVVAGVAKDYFPVPLRVITMPGAGSSKGTKYVFDSKPDGYTLLVNISWALIISSYLQKVPYTTVDFKGICQLDVQNIAWAVRSDSQWKTFPEFVKYARSNPGKLSYASSGVGGSSHIITEMIMDKNKIELVHVPYKGGAAAVLALLGGHVDVACNVFGALMPSIKAGDVRILAQFTRERSGLLPEVPTAIEQGFDIVVSLGNGITARADVPQERINYLEERFLKILADQSFISLATKTGAEPSPIGAADYTQYLYRLNEELKPIIKKVTSK
ncbi:MAG: Bug family tripartite tricarboxylate transporter substrate binding protein [Candidatus Hodarchaeota archaeon]